MQTVELQTAVAAASCPLGPHKNGRAQRAHDVFATQHQAASWCKYGPRHEPEFDFADFFDAVFVYPLGDMNFLVLDADVVLTINSASMRLSIKSPLAEHAERVWRHLW